MREWDVCLSLRVRLYHKRDAWEGDKPLDASSCRTSSLVRVSDSPVGWIQRLVPRGKRVQLNISGQGNPKALITGRHPSLTASHKLRQGLSGPFNSGRHTGANSEHKNFFVSRWQSLDTRGSQDADCCWASLRESWPNKLGIRISLYPIPWQRDKVLGMGLHTERTEELNPTDDGTKFRELSVAKENEDIPIRLSIDTTKVMACVFF